MSRHFGERAKKRQTTPNVAMAKARKRANREKRLRAEMAEAAGKGITVEQLRREKREEADEIRRKNPAIPVSGGYSDRWW